MPLQFVTPRESVFKQYYSGLIDLTGLKPERGGEIHLPVYVLHLSALAGGSAFDDAVLSGCRFLKHIEELGPVCCEMTGPGRYGKSRFRALIQGPKPAAMYAQLDALQQSPLLADQSYEVAVLNIPELFLECFWLRATEPAAGRIFVFQALEDHWRKPAGYPLSELLPLLRDSAEIRKAANAEFLLG